MSSSNVIADGAKSEFWAVVEACLSEFHGMKPETIRRKAGKLRSSIERMTADEMEFFYHSEPFDVANEIADDALKIEAHIDRYIQIRDGNQGSGIAEQKIHGGGKGHFKK